MASPQSSFIPKNPINAPAQRRRVRKIYVFSYVVYVIFVAALIGTAGVWFYKQTLEAELVTLTNNIATEQNNFRQSDLEQVAELDARLTEAERLLSSRVSINALFGALEEVTVSEVVLTGFSYQKDEGGMFTAELGANATDFNAALFQRSVLATNPILEGASITEITYGSAEGGATEGAEGEQLSFTISKELTGQDLPISVQTTVVEETAETEPAAVSSSGDDVIEE